MLCAPWDGRARSEAHNCGHAEDVSVLLGNVRPQELFIGIPKEIYLQKLGIQHVLACLVLVVKVLNIIFVITLVVPKSCCLSLGQE